MQITIGCWEQADISWGLVGCGVLRLMLQEAVGSLPILRLSFAIPPALRGSIGRAAGWRRNRGFRGIAAGHQSSQREG